MVAGGGGGFDGSVGLCTRFLTAGLKASPRRRAGGVGRGSKQQVGDTETSERKALSREEENKNTVNKDTPDQKRKKEKTNMNIKSA